MSLLEEIRARARKKREAVDGEGKDKIEYADIVVKLFSNTDYIKGSKELVIQLALFYLGYSVRESEEVYHRLMDEITRTYKVVSPEMLAGMIEEEKKTEATE